MKPEALRTAADGCGILTYAFPLRDVARAYALLADPAAAPAADPRHELGPALTTIRDAMLTNPEMVGGNRDRLDTSVMKALPSGSSASRDVALPAIAVCRARASDGGAVAGSGIAIKIEDGDGTIGPPGR